jgi:pimeloyl-ACP methyl ester carboxylesterase
LKSFGAMTLAFANHVESKQAGLTRGLASINGVKTHFSSSKSAADAPTLLLLHGFSADKYIWNRFAKQMAKDFNLLIPDMLGHGDNSYDDKETYSVPRQVEHILSLLDYLNIDSVIPIGNSMGGMMVAQLLKVSPERVIKAVLIDPAGAKTEFATYMHESKHNPFIHKDFNDFQTFYESSMYKPPFIPKFVIKHLAQQYIQRQAQYAHMFGDFFNINDFFSDTKLGKENQSLLIWGDKDELLPLSDHKMWESILDTKALVYKNIGHMPMVETPKRCANDIKRFINTI